jgi:beta-mannosidase
VTSWAAVDGDERPKPLWYALRNANAPRLLTVQQRDGHDALVAVNDTADLWHATMHVSRQRLDGTPLAEATMDVRVGARSVTALPLPADVATPDDPAAEVLVARLDGVMTVHTWVEDVDLALDPAPLEATVTGVEGGYRVDVVARSLARDVTILADRVDPAATVDEALITVPAGGRASFRVRTSARLSAADLTDPAVLRTANDLAPLRAAVETPA